MRVHCLQHVPFEKPGLIEPWVQSAGGLITYTRLYQNESLPPFENFDFLLVLGGPMNVYQHRDYPWLPEEKAFILKAIRQRKKILGICLGAQLIADVLGAKVYQNSKKEIGWYPICFQPFRFGDRVFEFPQSQPVFHWHGDTFNLPPGAVRFASSAACENQAFAYSDHVIGLQFHLEMTETGIEDLMSHCGDELVPGQPYIQSPSEMRANSVHITGARSTLMTLLDVFRG